MSFEILDLNQTKQEKIDVFVDNISRSTIHLKTYENVLNLFKGILDRYENKINVLYNIDFNLSYVDINKVVKNLKDIKAESYLFITYNELCDRIECSDNFFIYDMSIVKVPDAMSLNITLVDRIYLRGYSLGFTDKIILLQKG